MARQRYINTKFWSDDWVSHLDPVEKLLFIYLLTNERTNICGVYELPLKYMAVETGIDKDMVEKIMKRFEKDGKVYYDKGWVAIKNFTKHQDTKNEKINTGIKACLAIAPQYLIDRLSIGYVYPPNNSNSNINTNSNSIAVEATADINPIMDLFKGINPNYERLFSNKTQRAALVRLVKKFGKEKIEDTLKALPAILVKKYSPRISTPLQLEQKLGELIMFTKQEKSNKPKARIIQ
jgi:hypothetical protein